MKRIFLLLAAALLTTAVAAAQNTQSPKAGTAQNPAPQAAAPWASSTSSQTVIRGCLSGSSGNYTLTDQNGMQYQVAGEDATLRSMVGREVEITASENPTSEAATQGDEAHPGNGVQASNVRAVSPTCHKNSSPGETGTPDNNPDSNGTNPKGTPESSEPPSPQLMSMLQQQSAPDTTANGAS